MSKEHAWSLLPLRKVVALPCLLYSSACFPPTTTFHADRAHFSFGIQAFIMTNEKLCLKWNDFQDIIQVSFEELKSDNDFTDVTLACEDQSIKAHKVILSACSPFFKRLLKAHPNPQPLIYMRGIKTSDLVAVVDFIYQGEANIY